MSPTAPLTPSEILEALTLAEDLPHGTSRVARLQELAAQARALADNQVIIATHLELVNSQSQAGSDPRDQLAHLARVHRMWQQQPSDFDSWHRHVLFWAYKFAASALMDSPEVPLAAVLQWLDTMQDQYAQAGHSMFAVHQARHMVADHVGDAVTAAEEFRAWRASPRDELADCAACVANMAAEYLISSEQPDEALRVLAPVISGAVTCDTGPHRALSHTLLPALQTGQLELARRNHLHGYRLSRRNPGELDSVGRHAAFAALTGNVGRGLEIVADHARWLTETDLANPARQGFLEGVSLVLREACAEGLQGVPVQLGAERVDAAVALARIENALDALTDAYDRRNGTTAAGLRSRAARTRAPLAEHLPLGLAAAPTPIPHRSGAAAPADSTLEASSELPAVADPHELLDAAVAALDAEDGERTVELGLRLASGAADEVLVAHGQMLAAQGYSLIGQPGAAVELAEAAHQAYAHAGHPNELPSLVTLGRVKLRSATDEAEAASAARTLARAAQALDQAGDEAIGQLAEVSVDVARALARSDQPGAAAAAFERAAQLWAPQHPGHAAVLLAERASALAEADEADPVVQASFERAYRAAEVLPESDPARVQVDALHFPWLEHKARFAAEGSTEESLFLTQAQTIGARLVHGWLTLEEPACAVEAQIELLDVQLACGTTRSEVEHSLRVAHELVEAHDLHEEFSETLAYLAEDAQTLP